MPATPTYPVAVIADDGVPVRMASLSDLTREIEPQDVDSCLVVDSVGRAFKLRLENATRPGLFQRLLSGLGTVDRFELVEFESPELPSELRHQIDRVLNPSPSSGVGGQSS